MHVFIHPTGNVKRAAVSRSVAVDEDEVLVDTHSAASAAAADPLAAPGAGRARASRLALDVVSGVPFDLIAYVGLVTLGRMEPGEAAAVAGPLKLLHLARLYRVRWFFRCARGGGGDAGCLRGHALCLQRLGQPHAPLLWRSP
jgi:hypothetical protein